MRTKILVFSLFLSSFFGYSQFETFSGVILESFLLFQPKGNENTGAFSTGMLFYNGKGLPDFYMGNGAGNSDIPALNIQQLGGDSRITLRKDTIELQGKIGIGTDDPQNELSVNGTIWAKEVIVSLEDGADWVFEEDYNLKPLAEVEAFIKRNKHLPEMPSANDFRANDMKVSEMTNRLLQKIEELTLYTIEQEKKLEELEVLKARLAKLEALLVK